MKKYFLILILISLFISSCDDLEQTVNYQLPFVEKLVIQGEFGINNDGFTVIVTKTLPPLEKVTLEKVTVPDAECKVYFKDTVIDLKYTQFASSYSNDLGLKLEEGIEYKLVVKWKDKIATATSTIPKLPIIKSIRDTVYKFSLVTDTIFLFDIQSIDKGMIRVNSIYNSFDFDNSFELINNIGSDYTIGYVDYYNSRDETIPKSFFMQFYDVAYYPYYITKEEGQSESGIFSGGGLNVEGNVKGENTIGLWIGYNQLVDSIDKYIVK